MNNEKIEKSCKNCKHFSQHYVISGNNTIVMANCGHCFLTVSKPEYKKRLKIKNDCEKWESDTTKKQKRMKSIEATIRDMEKHLKEIKQILKFEK
ncbi:MAG: hypothetical protein OSJ27_10700 [Candidatus Gastranaerophilales bacterium]|nr:hypothetical protein [Candidatus Gastranaerophilales bacterium]